MRTFGSSRALACSFAALVFGVSSPAQSIRLNDPFPYAQPGRISQNQATPDGQLVVFIGSQEKYEVFRLYVVPSDGSASPRPLDDLVPFGDVQQFQLGSAGKRAAYVADHDADGVFELYAVEVEGPAVPVKLSGPMPASGDVQGWSFDYPTFAVQGERVLYRADQETDETFELFGAPLDGSSPPVKLSPPFVAGGLVGDFALSPDGKRAIFTADAQASGRLELYGAPSDGSAPAVKLSALVTGGDVTGFQISPDGMRVVYRADQEQDERFELFQVPADGSAPPVKLNQALGIGGDVARQFHIASVGNRVLFVADVTNDDHFLYSVPIDRSQAPIALSRPADGDAVVLSDSNSHGGLLVSPDGRRAVFTAQRNSDPPEVYSARVEVAASSVRISTPPPSGSGARILEFAISPDSARVVYRAERPVRNRLQLFVTPIDGSAGAVGVIPGTGNGFLFEFTPDARTLVYGAEQEQVNRLELWAVPVDLSASAVKLNGPIVQFGRILFSAFHVSPDGQRVFYLAFQDSHLDLELYCSALSRERQPLITVRRR